MPTMSYYMMHHTGAMSTLSGNEFAKGVFILFGICIAVVLAVIIGTKDR